MSDKIMVEVLDAMPAATSTPGRLVLLVLARDAATGTRESWPGRETLIRRTGLQRSALNDAIGHLVKIGLIERIPIGVNNRGEPVFTRPGRRPGFRIAVMADGRPEFRSGSTGKPVEVDRDSGRVEPESRLASTGIPAPLDLKTDLKTDDDDARAPRDVRQAVRAGVRQRLGVAVLADTECDRIAGLILGDRTVTAPARYVSATLRNDENPARFLQSAETGPVDRRAPPRRVRTTDDKRADARRLVDEVLGRGPASGPLQIESTGKIIEGDTW